MGSRNWRGASEGHVVDRQGPRASLDRATLPGGFAIRMWITCCGRGFERFFLCLINYLRFYLSLVQFDASLSRPLKMIQLAIHGLKLPPVPVS